MAKRKKSNRAWRILVQKIAYKLSGVITLKPTISPPRGRVLFSYLTQPFLLTEEELERVPHTNYWECRAMVQTFLDRGYIVDVIYWENTTFIPKHPYDIVVDLYRNLERLTPLLPPTCKKIMFIDGAHWQFQNNAELKRLSNLTKRRGAILSPRRQMQPSKNIEYADYVAGLGNTFTFSTYRFSHKKIHPIRLSTITTYPSPETKNFEAIKKNFVWIGGGGAVHKGLDLVLEVFKSLPDYHLTICGPLHAEKDFIEAYKHELALPNIKAVGRINVRTEQFKEIARNAVGLIYPSSSEGQSGSVITALHAGLIPIISYESGVDVGDFGYILKDNTIPTIKQKIIEISHLPTGELQERAIKTWEYANKNHTRNTFLYDWTQFIDAIILPSEPNPPLISVIIPTHNSEKTISEAIDSILNQTYKNIEVIVIDDDSTDNTSGVVKEISEKYKNVFYYKLPFKDPKRIGKNGRNINAGYSARNYGFEKAKGEWITFQDADDTSLLNRIETQYILAQKYHALHITIEWMQYTDTRAGATLDVEKILKEHPDIIIDSTTLKKMSKKSKGILMNLPSWIRTYIPFEIKTMRIINKLFFRTLESYPGVGGCPLFKREIVEKIHFRQRDARVWPSFVGRGADRDFNFEVAETFGKSIVCTLPLYLWRVNRENLPMAEYAQYIIPHETNT